ncbi:MAG TPA: AarF/ABC1/UbiB kinase family protein [Polyangiaceae bacterium]|nr:AarF/ABC1/UbiB kinase family protein [Polyangiaceae bacterium]
MSRRDGSVPVGRWRRLSQLSRAGAEATMGLLVSRDVTQAAAKAAEGLGSLRGLATKVGQMASYVDGLVPEAYESVMEDALRELRSRAPHSPPEAIRAIVESELKAPIAELFETWEEQPFASASIGQVHRATLRGGRKVAVKVQHPGIEEALESDLSNGAVVARLVGAVAPSALEAQRLYEEVASHFRDELDYRKEAAWQERFRALHAGDPDVVVPSVVAARSTRRVLCTDLMEGVDLDSFSTYGERIRRKAAETLWRFVYESILTGGLFNADPHPGNYLFRPDGTVVFLDFGCVQMLSPEVQWHSREAHRAAIARNEAAFASHAAAIVDAKGGTYETVFVDYLRACMEPVFHSPYRITRKWVRGLVTGLYDLKRDAFKKGSNFVPLPESTVLLNRLQLGFFSVLARLDVEVDYRAVEQAFLPMHESLRPV